MKYYQSNKRMYPVEVREDGSIMLHHAQTGEPLKQQTANMIRTFGSVDALLKSCKESPAHDLNEFSKWASKVESAKGRKMKAEAMLSAAEYELKKLQHRVKNYSYAETKAMGCIAQVNAAAVVNTANVKGVNALQYIDWELAHIICSDAHSVDHRPPNTKAAYQFVEKKLGSQYRDWLIKNSRDIFGNRYFDEPVIQKPKKFLGRWR